MVNWLKKIFDKVRVGMLIALALLVLLLGLAFYLMAAAICLIMIVLSD